MRIAYSTAVALTAGSAPGRPRRDRRDLRVRLGTERDLGTVEHLGARAQLDVHLDPDDRVVARDGVVVVHQRAHRAISSSGALSEQRAVPGVLQQRLERRAHPVQPVVGLGRRQDLEPDRQAVVGQSRRQRHPGDAGQVRGDRRDVVQVHRQRVVELLAELERRGRRRRGDEHVGLLERGREVALDERADLLRRAVVGVVVARRQRVGAQDDAALDLVAEALAAGGGHDALGRRVVLRDHPQAEPHAVELGQVAGRLGRQDQVVRRERVGEVRAGDLDDLGTGAPQDLQRLLEPREHAGLVALALQLGDDADAHARQVTGRARAAPRRPGRAAARRSTCCRAGRGRR